MRIAQISPLNSAVPPIAYGGTEIIVHLLTEALIRRGHQVTLFASGDSVTSARLIAPCKQSLKDSKKSQRQRHILGLLTVVNCLNRAGDFDIIHNHAFPEGLALAARSSTPCLTTFHENLNGMGKLFKAYEGWYNTVSRSQKMLMPPKERFVGVVYNAIDVGSFPFSANRERQGYMLFLASLLPKKGAHIAIEVAKRLGKKLIIAGNINEGCPDYYYKMVAPEVDGQLIRYFGEANQTEKRKLLPQADCLVSPILWEEPFGLQFIEAMACGTPVVAFHRGAVPEIVRHGRTGFVVEDIDGMVAAVKNLHWIDRAACRRDVEERFNAPRMVEDYLRVYEDIFERC
jgi:glycosyltransferase involved in cell wall biosynthesis